jgi:hypothetical protein
MIVQPTADTTNLVPVFFLQITTRTVVRLGIGKHLFLESIVFLSGYNVFDVLLVNITYG